jgi:ABC-type antimicrobial peptide transport system permease subunit
MRLLGTKENIVFALKAIRDHKLRSSLTVVGIVVGVMTVISMISLLQGFNDQVMGDFMRFGSTLVQFQKYDIRFGGGPREAESQRLRKNLTHDDAEAIRRLCPSVAAVSPSAMPTEPRRSRRRAAKPTTRGRRSRSRIIRSPTITSSAEGTLLHPVRGRPPRERSRS